MLIMVKNPVLFRIERKKNRKKSICLFLITFVLRENHFTGTSERFHHNKNRSVCVHVAEKERDREIEIVKGVMCECEV